MGIYYLENIPWMWFMTFCALFILKNWAVVWGGERNYLVSILLNNQMDNYKLIQFTDNKILFFIVIKITILSSTLYVIVLLYLKYLILMWPMSSKYIILSICLLLHKSSYPFNNYFLLLKNWNDVTDSFTLIHMLLALLECAL